MVKEKRDGLETRVSEGKVREDGEEVRVENETREEKEAEEDGER